jgi:diphthamide synthase (EF-2-diphthine--ammonia ligase)
LVLDWIIVVAASYGLAAWVAGHLLTRNMARARTELANKPEVHLLADCPHR